MGRDGYAGVLFQEDVWLKRFDNLLAFERLYRCYKYIYICMQTGADLSNQSNEALAFRWIV